MRHERSAAKRASILDGGPSGGYKRQHRLQRGAPLYCVNAVILESQGMKQPSELTPGNSEQCDKHQVVRFFGGLLL